MRNIVVTGAIAIAVLLGGWFLVSGPSLSSIPGLGFLMSASAVVPSALSADVPYTGAPLTKEYKNDTYRFSLSMPEDFNGQELAPDESGGTAILLQNAKGEGIQIYVTPNQGDISSLSADDVRASIPDMQVTEEQALEIGADHTGVAFKSDNEAFGGESREVWFVFRGNLYQISTYAHLDPLMKAMFGTWKFTQ